MSELRKVRSGTADRNLAAWADRQAVTDLYLSVITVEELEIGVLLAERRDKPQAAIFRTWLNRHVLPTFAGRILPVDLPIAQRSATLHIPNPRPIRDAHIAATALVHNMTIATRNTPDFTRTGAHLINPWQV